MSTLAFAQAPTPASRYGASLLGTSPRGVPADTPLNVVAGPTADDQTSVLHPDHPVFWLGLILAGAVGLAYFSTTVRVGPVKATGSVGDDGK